MTESVDTGSEAKQERSSRFRSTDRSKFAIFKREDAGTLSEFLSAPPVWPEEAAGIVDPSLLRKGIEEIDLPFCHSGDVGYSVMYVRFRPGYIVWPHSHNDDCLYVILRGSIALGSHELHAREGFYVPRDQRYGYRVGDAGVEVLEFRYATSTDAVILENRPERFQGLMDNAAAHGYWE